MVDDTPPGTSFDDAERLARLRLIRSETIGPATFEALIRRFETGIRALEALPDLARRGGRPRPLRITDAREAERELAAIARHGAHLLMAGETGFPFRLSVLDPPPPMLCIHGDIAFLETPCVAIVGARNASALGRQFAERMAQDLGAHGFTVVSGLARGIDGSAHGGALDTGTIAVLAGGVDHIYPPEHGALADAIVRNGALVSEMPFGFSPQARHFPRRNRLVSGLSLGVIVIEAAARSGSLITARHALDQGREVFAVPGSPLDPRARGGNQLLKDGATLTEGIDDVLEVLKPILGQPGLHQPAQGALSLAPPPQDDADQDLKAAREALWPLLGPTPTPVDNLIRTAGVPADLALTVLLEWDLAGRIRREAGGQVSATIDAG